MGFSVYTFGGQLLSMHGDKGSHLVRYDNFYEYTDLGNPFAVSHIHDNENGVDRELCWDDNGNLVKAISDGSNRYLCWTEDNRLQAFMEQGEQGNIAAWYNYSASGERNFKLASPRMSLQQNAEPFSNPPLVYPTLYASPLVTLTKHGYTKHYFEEGRRICSKIGGGLLGNVTAEDIEQLSPALADDYPVLYDRQRTGVVQTFRSCLGADPLLEDEVNFRSLLVEYETQHDDDEPAFFYHSDHLGSAAYLTSNGNVVQTLNYLPYGEDWVERNYFSPGDTTRLGIYRFNGKEKDYESGFHYYGARYYWSELLSGWLSVDPMADKYPSISPYAYCAWNPVKLVDPDGREMTDFRDKNGKLLLHVEDGSNAVFQISGTERTNEFFAFIGYSDQGGANSISFTGLIAGAQEYALDYHIYCNQAVNFVGKTYNNAYDALGIDIVGGNVISEENGADEIMTKLKQNEVPYFEKNKKNILLIQQESADGAFVVGVKKGHVCMVSTRDYEVSYYYGKKGNRHYSGGRTININGNTSTGRGPRHNNSSYTLDYAYADGWYIIKPFRAQTLKTVDIISTPINPPLTNE